MDMRTIGIIVFAIGMIIFLFGRKFILIRLYFKKRSVFSQLFWGIVIAAIGVAILYFDGALGWIPMNKF
ncbi:hypothetical protein R55227_BLOPHJLP_01676 [Fructobacillus tropaeoli]|uniref:hypothetical protein n=1 Tax=Fructobacillus tropaeoli TaxID=709323 RepID=UPI002D9C3C7D|nr:hypothetical protein R55227_BLOPHJLP_01676 [Fructobacillus tropaeoli]